MSVGLKENASAIRKQLLGWNGALACLFGVVFFLYGLFDYYLAVDTGLNRVLYPLGIVFVVGEVVMLALHLVYGRKGKRKT
ncbi:hypothetical protein A6E01_19035 (plasmid) [Vibrio breoganii]|uniref:Uncharacterized protein n=1 Tax=Vibrio breoganii TaxID=553239 RepID=A0AAN0XZ50_9VIBR|nr:hypothetical protein [Vibrio breoganii]ANO35309.1 hypothetical protein A6E01_19035 [Vibrio breoganii]